jgi:hypothetical protein
MPVVRQKYLEIIVVVWFWDSPREIIEFGAKFDGKLSAPVGGHEYLNDSTVKISTRPVFKSNNSLKRFKSMHSPPIGNAPVIDNFWKEIVLKYVPEDRVQFLPIRLVARGETCDDFMWIIPFDRVRSIDIERSDISRKVEKPGLTMIFSARHLVFRPDFLSGLHLARDEQMPRLMFVSDELKQALVETGESSMFKRL